MSFAGLSDSQQIISNNRIQQLTVVSTRPMHTVLRAIIRFLILLVFLAPVTALSSGDECWYGFGIPGTDGTVYTAVLSGTDMYLGGSFRTAAGINAGGIARWSMTEHRWYALGTGNYPGVNGTIHAIAVQGDLVYVGGAFSSVGTIKAKNIAVFNRKTLEWSEWGGGAGRGFDGSVRAIAVRGNDIYVGGDFTAIGSSLASNIARWDGTRWNRLEGGTVGVVYALAIAGGDLYAGGLFTAAGTVQSPNIARWDGNQWFAVGKGVNGAVYTITPDGGDLLVGGKFTKADNINANSIVRYTPTTSTWQAFGTGVGGSNTPPPSLGIVYAISRQGKDIYVGGDFMRAGSELYTTRRMARWNGSQWYALRDSTESFGRGVSTDLGGESTVRALVSVGDEIYVGGRFDTTFMKTFRPGISDDGMSFPYIAFNIARWNTRAKHWQALGDAPNHYITSLAGSGGNVYLGGQFSTAGGVEALNIAEWNTAARSWAPLDTGLGGIQSSVRAIAVDTGGVIHAAIRDERDEIETIVTVTSYVGRWDPVAKHWGYLGSKMTGFEIMALATDANAVYIGGTGSASAGSGSGILSWTGSEWSALGGGVNGSVYTIAVDKNWVYVGGEFSMAGTVPASNIARWNRITGNWQALGAGVDSTVYSITFANGSIYVGGKFTSAGAMSANHIASWDLIDGRWKSLGSGVNAPVRSLAQHTGIIYAGGEFTTAGDITAPHVAAWDGEVWGSLGTGVNGPVHTLAVGSGGVFVAGEFDVAGNKPTAKLARWDNVLLAVQAAPAVTGGSATIHCSPNPFTDRVAIHGNLSLLTHAVYGVDHSELKVTIHDALGRHVATLAEGLVMGSDFDLEWDATGSPSGIYFCRIDSNGQPIRSISIVKW